MKKIRTVCALLLALAVALSAGALAESRYEALCRENTVQQECTTAWIEIPGSGFCSPVMQHSSDDSFYASHDASGAEAETGALYTQKTYNKSDFSDPVTVIYGSSKAEGAPFRELQQTFSGSFDECRRILLHLPEETVEYEVFAAVPYTSIHILHYYDFTVKRRYESFFSDVYSTRLLGMHLDEAGKPEFGDRVLILSTGLRGDNMQRYLVMARPISA